MVFGGFGVRAVAGRFVVGVLGVLVARDLKVFYTHKFYTHAFFLIFRGFFRILRAKSIFHNGLRNVFSEQSPPQNPQKNPPAASAGLKGK